jgi:hypothetical protein
MHKTLTMAWMAVCVIFGAVILVAGAVLFWHGGATEGETGGTADTAYGLAVMAAGAAIGVFPFFYELGKFIRSELRAYNGWKDGLTPEQRAGVRAAETAAIVGGALVAHEVMHRHHEAASAQLTESIMGGPRPDPFA